MDLGVVEVDKIHMILEITTEEIKVMIMNGRRNGRKRKKKRRKRDFASSKSERVKWLLWRQNDKGHGFLST